MHDKDILAAMDILEKFQPVLVEQTEETEALVVAELVAAFVAHSAIDANERGAVLDHLLELVREAMRNNDAIDKDIERIN